MVLLEKQGLCSQATRQPQERSASLPPSSLPRPKRSPGKKLGEYGRLSDSKEPKGESSPVRIIPLGRKVGEYGRLSDSESRKTSDSEKLRESPGRSLLPPRSYSRLESDSSEPKKQEKDRSVSRSPVSKVADPEIRMSPVQKYNRFFDKAPSENSGEFQNPKRSFLPPPRKISDFGCFEEQAKQESKLRRGSLHREQQGAQQPPKTGVRSLPSPNKYRIQF